MVDNLHLVDDSMFREYEELRDLMRTTKISISEEDAANIPDLGSGKNPSSAGCGSETMVWMSIRFIRC